MSISNIITDQKTFHTLEIYPSDKQDASLNDIIVYMKDEWLSPDKHKDFPLYSYCHWPTLDEDMLNLSTKFKKCIFIILGKKEYFIDGVWAKTFKSGKLVKYENNIEHNINLLLESGNRKITQEMGIEPNIVYDTRKYFINNNKSFMDAFNLATNMTVITGQTVASLGGLVGEAATAAKILSIGMTLINQMQQNLNNYGKNRGKCANLTERCNNIVNALQKIPSSALNLQYVVCVINKIEDAKNLIDEYLKKWRITKFFLSSEYNGNFSAINQNLSDSFNDFFISYQLSKERA